MHPTTKIICIVPAFFMTLLFLSLACGDTHQVVFVYDGDTILLQNGTKVRYTGINTPEIDHEDGNDELFSREAKDLNTELVNLKAVSLEYDRQTKDRYKRTLAYVFIENGEMINALMVKNGLAYVASHKPNLRYRGYLIHIQRQAMEEKLGIWKNLPKEEKTEYRGNKKSFRFHRKNCPSGRQIPINHRVQFSSMYNAFWEGYSPCHRCLPRWFEKPANVEFTPNTPPRKKQEDKPKVPSAYIPRSWGRRK